MSYQPIWKASLASLSFITLPGALPPIHSTPSMLAQASALKVPASPPQPFGTLPEDLPQPPSTAVVENSIALYESLTSEQQQKLQVIYKRYQPQLNALMQQLPPLPASLPVPTFPTQGKAEVDRHFTQLDRQFMVGKRVAAQLEVLQKQINREAAAVLTQEQRQVFQAGLIPSEIDLSETVINSDSEHF
jgi:Spy/CpxP family protein refolding chaperone